MDRRSRKVAIVLLPVGFVLVEDVVPLLADLGAAGSIPIFTVREHWEGNFVGCIALDIIRQRRAASRGCAWVGGLVAEAHWRLVFGQGA